MKKIRLILPLLTLLIMIGCGDETKPPTSSIPEPPAITIAPELESALTAQMDELSGAGDLSSGGPHPSLDTNFDYYAVVFVWGTLRPTTILGGPIIDWSGSLTGDIRPVHAIDFEPETDSILSDAASPGIVEWASSTLLEYDGIAGILRHDRRNVYVAEPRIYFTTKPFSIDIALSQLDHYFGIFPVDSTNAVVVMARRIERRLCAHGQFKGEWVRDDISAFKGAMHGIWFNSGGDSVGRYAGRYWVTDSGNYLFEGTISGLVTDDIKGHFKGKWWFDDPRMCPSPECGTGHGRFVGKLAYLISGSIGEISGEFGDMTGHKAMPMHGDWRIFCRGLNPERRENPSD